MPYHPDMPQYPTAERSVTYPFNSDLRFAQVDASVVVARGGIVSQAPHVRAEDAAKRDAEENKRREELAALVPVPAPQQPAQPLQLEQQRQAAKEAKVEYEYVPVERKSSSAGASRPL